MEDLRVVMFGQNLIEVSYTSNAENPTAHTAVLNTTTQSNFGRKRFSSVYSATS
jgi:hypothetical protein